MIFKKLGALGSFRIASLALGISDIAIFMLLENSQFQSFYYSVLAIIGLQVLFELGTITVIQTWSSLTYNGDYRKITHRSVSEFTFIFAFFSSILFCVVSICYLMLLVIPFSNEMWVPKLFIILYSFCSSLHFFNLFFFAYRVGMGDLSRVYFHRTIALLLAKIIYVVLIFSSGAYETILLIPFVQAIYGTLFNYRTIIKSINFRFINFKKLFLKFWDLQRKLMLSWLGGFMLFNSVIPTMHLAGQSNFIGQYGLTFAALQGIMSISTIYMSTQLPSISHHYKAANINLSKNIFTWSVKSYVLAFITGAFTLFAIAEFFELDIFFDIDFFTLISAVVFLNGFGILINEFSRAHAEDFTNVATFLVGILMLINCSLFIYHGSLWLFLLLYGALFFGLTIYSVFAVKKCFRLYGLQNNG